MSKDKDTQIDTASTALGQPVNTEPAQPTQPNGALSSWWNRLNDRFNRLLEERRGVARVQSDMPGFNRQDALPADTHLAIRRPRNAGHVKLLIPEDVIIAGHLMGSSDTEVSGHIDGNLAVEGRLYLGATGRISGDVRAAACRIEGEVEGHVECSEELDLEKTGRLNANVRAGKRIYLAGQVYGNVTTKGNVRLAATAVVNGDIEAQALIMEDGAMLNGACHMCNAAQKSEDEL